MSCEYKITDRGVANLHVEACDKDPIFDDRLGNAETDKQEQFQIEFTEADFREWFLDRRRDLFFKIFDKEELIHSTKNSVLWNCDRTDLGTADNPLIIAVDSISSSTVSIAIETSVYFLFNAEHKDIRFDIQRILHLRKLLELRIFRY